MNIVFRVDGNQKIGFGHLVRCNSIAEGILNREPETEISFFSDLDKAAKKIISLPEIKIIPLEKHKSEESNLRQFFKENKVNLLFIDNTYLYEEDFILEIRETAKTLLFHVFRNACFYSDLYILPSAHTDDSIINHPKWNVSETQFLFGPDYIVISDQLQEIKNRKDNRKTLNKKTKVVITTGGSDPKAVLLKIIDWLSDDSLKDIEICILKGKAFVHESQLQKKREQQSKNIEIKDFDLNEFFDADIAVCTFGVTTYELLYLGIPVLSIGHALTNAQGSKILNERHQAIVDSGYIGNLKKEIFLWELNQLISNKQLQNRLKKTGKTLIDGKGLDRVIDELFGLFHDTDR